MYDGNLSTDTLDKQVCRSDNRLLQQSALDGESKTLIEIYHFVVYDVNSWHSYAKTFLNSLQNYVETYL